ncbi:uncharacterized protein M421DRAFT_7248 [Didymella exigua CBS 183.55]|uniref:Uncharacterized protein n=1 Tax=Didymella exigua CBS 183.55 TaxID=1150837 RepID=A0A6A5RHT4_9PLEO|nr:uncharacterized protein M421DRAFT_7248 [Didymella exigua CBS 183.55]KAF1926016.1 hypothetical protein M421DRAFT_7248 [Didymella exigua CBS 183.55]
MTGILCVWAANLPECSEQWYEDEYIPEVLSRHSDRALLAEMVETPFDKELEGVGTRDAVFKSLVLYEIAEVPKIINATYDKSNHPVMDGLLRETRFDTRPYELIKSWQSDDDWNGDAADVVSILFFEWQPHAGFEEEVVGYYEREMGYLLCQAVETLRVRWFQIKNATVLKGNLYNTLKSEDLHTYMCLVEMSCEEWPWIEFFEINELPGWKKYFEDQRRVRWQVSQYVVKRSYPDAEGDEDDA